MGKLKLQLFAKSVEELAKEVIRGNYGNGEQRKKALGSQYAEVQKTANEMLDGTYKPASTKTNTTKDTPKTNNTPVTNNNAPKIAGVDSSLVDTITSTYTPDDDVKQAETNKINSGNAYKDWASNTDIIDQGTWEALNKQFVKPQSVIEADKFLEVQREQIRSGRTSYTDQVEALFNKYMNREDFQYDASEDQLFQQALASAMGSGKTAMQDTIGQASALTGGYGSTYATSAGNQAYNSFIEDAYNNLPEYYNMALQAYQMEGDEMLQQFNMAATLDNQEYGRLVDSYNVGVEERNWQYNTAFNEYQTGVTNAYNSANLQIQQNAQIGNNLYNTYLVDKDVYETKYNQGYQAWLDVVNSAVNIAGMQNTDWWKQTELDYQKERDKVADAQWQKSYELELASVGAKYKNGNETKGATLTNTELEKVKEVFVNSGGDYEQVDNYLTTIGKNDLDDETNAALMSSLSNSSPAFQDWTISKDTYNGGFLGTPLWAGDDHNDEYSNGTTVMTYKQLKEAINNSNLSPEAKKKKLDELKKQSKK